jgi:hypothetical protein
MAAEPRTRELLEQLDTISGQETRVLDVLLEHGAELERSERQARGVSVAELQTLGASLAGLDRLVDELQARIATAETDAAGDTPTVESLMTRLGELEAESGRVRAQLRDRIAALEPDALATGAPGDPAAATNGTPGAGPATGNGTAPPASAVTPGTVVTPATAAAPRTFRLGTPAMKGPDVLAFQRVLNVRFDRWGMAKRIGEDGEYGTETRNAARQVAIGLGSAEADFAHGITPHLRSVIRTPSRRSPQEVERADKRRPWLRRLRDAQAKKAGSGRPKTASAKAPSAQATSAAVAHDDGTVATAIRAAGGRWEDAIVREARRSGVPVSLVCAVIEQESGFRNVFGHDRVPNPVKSPPGGLLEVTEGRYRDYLRHRKLGHGNQGVGPMQLTWPGFQDRADDLGGCWRPEANIRVGAGVLADNVRKLGHERGVQKYNGAPGNAYATSVLKLERTWRARLDGAHAVVSAPVHRAPEAPEHHAPAQDASAAGGPIAKPLHRGSRSEAARALQAATKTRLAKRHVDELADGLEVDGVIGRKTMEAVTTAAWLLGAQRSTLNKMNASGEITVGIQRLVRNPGLRTLEQKALGKKRVAHVRADRGRRRPRISSCR